MVRIAITPGFDNDNFFTKEQSIADLEATPLTLTLDGATLPTIRKPITMLNIGFWKQRFDLPRPLIAFPTGSIFSPAALSIGDHTAGLVATDPVFGTFLDSSTFAVITWDTPKGMFTASPFGLSHQTSVFCEGNNGHVLIPGNRATKETGNQHENFRKRWFLKITAFYKSSLLKKSLLKLIIKKIYISSCSWGKISH